MFEFFRFELRQQLRSPVLWLLGALFALMAFAALTTDAVQVGGAIGNIHRNAPRVIIGMSVVFSFIGMLFVAMSVHAALLRDFEMGTAELIFASPIRRRDFMVGRIAAALVACLCVYALLVATMFVAQFMPWIDPERLGPVTLKPYAWSLAVIVLPNLLFTASLLSMMAVLTRSILWVYIGVLGFFVLYGVGTALLSDLDNVRAVALWEPLGRIAFSRTVRYWSAEELNTLVPAVDGMLLANRALWTGLSLLLFGVSLSLFRPQRTGTGRSLFRRKAASVAVSAPAPSAAPAPVARIVAPASTGARTALAQFLAQLRFDAAGVFRGVPFVIMLLFAIANFVPSALNASTLY
ncbi:MAG: ABC transporter permease, partial [Lysobacteraceae bacterium]